jgi:hypothetical protein
MANICMARLTIEQVDGVPDASPLPLPVESITQRLESLHYDQFEVCCNDEERIEIECGFRWSPPFEKLLTVSADFRVNLRCLYEDDGACFMGAWRAEDGKVVQDDCIDY